MNYVLFMLQKFFLRNQKIIMLIEVFMIIYQMKNLKKFNKVLLYFVLIDMVMEIEIIFHIVSQI